MTRFRLSIDGQPLEVTPGTTLLDAARRLGIYIPVLCHHPELPPIDGILASPRVYQGGIRIENAFPRAAGEECGLCVVAVEGEPDLQRACVTDACDGMRVVTDNGRIRKTRQEHLVPILARHPHSCLICTQQEGCSRIQCTAGVAENERCCDRFGHCELQKVADYVGISDTAPRWVPTASPVLSQEPLFIRDYNLCIGCTRCVRVCRDVRKIDALGFVFDPEGRVQVGSSAPTLAESGCKFCGACVEVCPTGALADKATAAGKKEGSPVPCKSACPVQMDVPEYVRRLADGDADAACAVIRETIPFPGVLGRICVRPCEAFCRRGAVNAPVAICALKRFAADHEKTHGNTAQVHKKNTGKRVAVVGAGPAGLTAAFYLRIKGHAVTVYDAAGEPGGMMRYGIPAFRLPREVVRKETAAIFDLGVQFVPGTCLGKEIHLNDLKKSGFHAVFLGIGAQLNRRIPLEDQDLPDVLEGIPFLRAVAEGKGRRLKEKVLVLGGGNQAVDVARTALRCGAKSVFVACLESEAEMPASPWELKSALTEGVTLLPSTAARKIRVENGRMTGAHLVACTGVFDENGNFRPRFGEQKGCLGADQIISAAGQAVDLSFLSENIPVSADHGRLRVDRETLETKMPRVFAGGDAVSLPGTVIHAVAHGRKAASAIDRTLGGDGLIEEIRYCRVAPDPCFGREDGFSSLPRLPILENPGNKERLDFAEIVRGYDDETAQNEARRCLQCDTRFFLKHNPAPPIRLFPLTPENIARVPDTEGVFRLLDAEKKVVAIRGTPALKTELSRVMEEEKEAAWFMFQVDRMYSKRESEWLQRHIQEYGRMPGFADEDDLF